MVKNKGFYCSRINRREARRVEQTWPLIWHDEEMTLEKINRAVNEIRENARPQGRPVLYVPSDTWEKIKKAELDAGAYEVRPLEKKLSSMYNNVWELTDNG